MANLKFLVLDEADKLVIDPVFFEQIKDIVELASAVQGGHYHRTLLLSATLDSAVMKVADVIMNADYFQIRIDPEKLLSETVEQQFVDVSKGGGNEENGFSTSSDYQGQGNEGRFDCEHSEAIQRILFHGQKWIPLE